MPNTTLDMTGGVLTSANYTEDGYVLEPGDSLVLTTTNGDTSLTSNSSNASFFLSSASGATFGLKTVRLDGYVNTTNAQGQVVSTAQEVKVTFTSQTAQGVITQSFITNDHQLGFQEFTLRPEFASGLPGVLIEVTPYDSNPNDNIPAPPNAFVSIDDIVLITNTAPTATGLVAGSVHPETDGDLVGRVGGYDPDANTTLTFSQYYPPGSPVQPEVTINSDGTFTVTRTAADDDLLPTQYRDVTFYYTVGDGQETSAASSATVRVYGLPQGPDIRLGNHPQYKDGTVASERMYGGNSGDTLCGLGGSDTLSGENGTDLLCGGTGRDRLDGGNGSDTLLGGAGNDILDGGNSPDRLEGGAGDDTLTGGQSPDEFYFGADWGRDKITDFDPKNEHIHFTPSPTLGSWADFLHLKDIGLIRSYGPNNSSTIIEDGQGNSLILENVKLSTLKADDFLFG